MSSPADHVLLTFRTLATFHIQYMIKLGYDEVGVNKNALNESGRRLCDFLTFTTDIVPLDSTARVNKR